MGISTVILIVLILMLLGVLPAWPHSKSWGYAPSGFLGMLFVIVLILILMGRI
jgi:fumarate reductase subunit D